MTEFKVTETKKTSKVKPGESSISYETKFVECVGKEKVGDKLTLTSEKPIDLAIGDEIKFEKIAFQKKLKVDK